MRAKLLVLAVTVFVSRDVTAETAATATGYPCKESVVELCNALKIENRDERQSELYRLLDLKLMAGDWDTRYNALLFLGAHDRELDPGRVERALRHFDELDGRNLGQATLDQAAFLRANREEHRGVYTAAIVDGKAPIGKASSIDRTGATRAAYQEGFFELRPLIEKYYSLIPETDRVAHNLSLDKIVTSLELREGGQSEADGNQLAAQRLDAMPAQELATKLEKSKGWRGALWDLRDSACSSDLESAGCKTMTKVFQRQEELLKTAMKGHTQQLVKAGARGTYPELTEGEKIRQEWLAGRAR